MKEEKYLKDIESLIPTLKECFIKYYGGYEERINEVLDSITFIVSNNDENSHLQFLSTNNEKRKNDLLKKIDINPNLYLSINGAHSCVIPKEEPPIIIIPFKEKISLHTLVHEINHTLHNTVKEEKLSNSLMSLLGGKKVYVEGMPTYYKDSMRMFYELINEYMTLDIINMFKEINKDNSNLDLTFRTDEYVKVDNMTGNKIYDIYQSGLDKIKNLLIQAKGEELVIDLGKDDYSSIDGLLQDLYEIINKYEIMFYTTQIKENGSITKDIDYKEVEKNILLNDNEKEVLNNILIFAERIKNKIR